MFGPDTVNVILSGHKQNKSFEDFLVNVFVFCVDTMTL